MTVKIIIPAENLVLKAEDGTNLYKVLSAHELLDAPCGGRGVCGKCSVTVDGSPFLSCDYILDHDVTVALGEKERPCSIVATGVRKDFVKDAFPDGTYGIAVDIGTTTVVAELVEMATGRELCSYSQLNSQKSFGQDVITRIHCTIENSDGLKRLQHAVLNDLRRLFGELCKETGVKPEQVTNIAVAGNTTMVHLFLGADPASIALAPFIPLIKGPARVLASELSLPAAEHCEVYCLPAVASFVGGDITGGILACSLREGSGRTLFIDIGTNGEIVLSNNGRLCCCSCAAGPALEGMNISCGARAAMGAIEDVRIDGSKVQITTIGGGPPTGLCGSGLLAAVAEMAGQGIISHSGRLQLHPPVAENQSGQRVFPLCAEKNLVLTQNDIRQVQLAKGAILSGIMTLLLHEGLAPEEVDKVVVAGQFGAHLKADSITGAGLMPGLWRDRISYAGKTSLSGAYLCLLSSEQRRLAEEVIKGADYIELSTLAGYEKLFIKSLAF